MIADLTTRVQDAIDIYAELGASDSEPQREVAEQLGRALVGDFWD